jgi:hypothetical protein
MALDKKYYREQARWSKSRLEKLYKLIDLNPIQIQELRDETAKLVEASENVITAPDSKELKGE